MRTSPTTRPRRPASLLSRWAIGWFLWPTGATAGTNNPLPLFSLRRRIRVVLDDTNAIPNTTTTYSAALNTGANGTTPIPAGPPANLWSARYAEVSCLPDTKGNIYFNTPTNLVNPAPAGPLAPGQMMPVSLTPLGANGQGQADWAGDDIVLTDVISFNVRVMYQLPPNAQGQVLYTPDFQDVNTIAPTPGSTTPASTRSRSPRLEITLRVWDVKTASAHR